jgi:predicted secreted hydrolase
VSRALRRRLLLALPALALARPGFSIYPEVTRGRDLRFPADHGAHPAYRTEWWYLSGWVGEAARRERGVQVTFFRNRPGLQEDNPSAFAPRQLLFAHAALADAAYGRLRHDQRAARAGFGLAIAGEDGTRLRLDDWSLELREGRYHAQVASREFGFELAFTPTQPVLPQGDAGFSRKAADAGVASYYYSVPHLAVSGSLRVGSRTQAVAGTAWLDHEWSSRVLPDQAQGWDWCGLNLDDGAALMAFRLRDAQQRPRWAAATLREASGRMHTFAPGAVAFTPLSHWRSPRTQAQYPVAMRVRVGALELDLEPLMSDQELDARASTGVIYWEGAVRALRGGRTVGRGYLELTGYAGRLRV